MGKKCYAIQLQTGEMLVERNPDDPSECVAKTFTTLRLAREENILTHGVIGTLTVGVANPFKPLDKNDFILRARELLWKLGAVATPGKYRSFQLPTRFGMLGVNLHVRGKYKGATGPGDFMCQFHDEAARDAAQAAGLFGSQKNYSGKWNHHYFGDVTVDEVIMDMEYKLKAAGAGIHETKSEAQTA
jgi:hypothetical protein